MTAEEFIKRMDKMSDEALDLYREGCNLLRGKVPSNEDGSDGKGCDHGDSDHISWRKDNGYHHEDNCDHSSCHDDCVSADECYHHDRRCSCHNHCHSDDSCDHESCYSQDNIDEKDTEIAELKARITELEMGAASEIKIVRS
jgi:hypothetical protein